MLSLKDIQNALTGSFLLAKRDIRGLKYFDTDLDGFWRSFLIILPIAPFYLLYAIQEVNMAQAMNPHEPALTASAGFLVARLFLLVLDWFGFAIAMIFVTRLVALWPKYIPFIAVYNWSSLFVVAASAPLALLLLLGLIPWQTAAMFNLIIVLFIIYYRWYVARCVLETTSMTAALIVVIDLALSLLLQIGFGRITGY